MALSQPAYSNINSSANSAAKSGAGSAAEYLNRSPDHTGMPAAIVSLGHGPRQGMPLRSENDAGPVRPLAAALPRRRRSRWEWPSNRRRRCERSWLAVVPPSACASSCGPAIRAIAAPRIQTGATSGTFLRHRYRTAGSIAVSFPTGLAPGLNALRQILWRGLERSLRLTPNAL